MQYIKFEHNSSFMGLDSWVMASVLQLGTLNFCQKCLNKSNDPKGRMFDQMTQAARSGQANIAEGSSRRNTSKETAMKLLDVARASLSELSTDFLLYLVANRQLAWSPDDPRYQALLSFSLERPQYGQAFQHDVTRHILAQRDRLSAYLDSPDLFVVANSLLILCNRVIRMLDKQIAGCLQRFKEVGGFAENLTRERLQEVQQAARQEEAPCCPKCGKPMIRRTVRRGARQGQQFWSCSDYPRCDGSGNI